MFDEHIKYETRQWLYKHKEGELKYLNYITYNISRHAYYNVKLYNQVISFLIFYFINITVVYPTLCLKLKTRF